MSELDFLSKYYWKWHFDDKDFEKEINNSLKLSTDSPTLIKKNPVRSVWKYGDLYIKHNHPQSRFDKFRFSIVPKAHSEFKALKILAEMSINAVKPLGWAKYGSQSLLITKEMAGFVNSKDYWFREACFDSQKKKKFLSSLANFAKFLVERKVIHKDFHLGNLLFNPESSSFALVDVYKLKVGKKKNQKEVFEIYRIISSVMGEINDSDALDFLINVGACNDFDSADSLWTKILSAEIPELRKKWTSMKQAVFTNSKFSSLKKSDGEKILIRKSILREELVSEAQLEQTENFIRIEEYHEQAKKIWLDSFLFELYRMPHHLPVALILPDATFKKAILIYHKEKCRNLLLSKQELIRRASIFRIPKRLTEKLISD